MKTEIKLSDKAIKFYCDWNSITLEDVSEIDRYEIKCMEQFAQQEKRETAIEFAEHVLNEVMPDAKILNNYVGYGGMYGKWKSNQEGE